MKTFIATSLVFLSLTCFAQRNNNPMSNLSFKDRLYFGGDITLSVSGSATVIGAAPMIGYRITEDWSAGVGISAYYFNVRAFNYSTSFYGGNIFSRYLILENVFLQSEFHLVNTDVGFSTPNEVIWTRKNIPLWYVGGGYRQPLGGRGYASITVLYDLIGDPNSPYPNPTIRAGVNFGFN
jgi:hypothetical protein